MKLRNLVPILDWLPKYKRSDLPFDLLAGLTVGVMLIPQGMAYGLLAGLPPIYGLYAGIVPLLLYAFFGTSRQLSVGPVALVSLLVLAGVSEFAEPGTAEFVALAIATALIAGIIQILLGGFRLGFLINFLSHPVIAGFTSAAAFIIGLSQVRNILGINIPRSNQIHEIIGGVIANIDQIHYPTLAIGIGGIALMLILRRIKRSLPGALIAVIVGTLSVYFFNLTDFGVAIVKEVPSGLPQFSAPSLNWADVRQLLPLALTICLISFIESLAIAKTIEARHRNYRIVPNQELIALGITKIGGAFFQSFPTTGSFTRSAINDEAGAKTGLSSIFAAIVISLTLLFLTPLFYYLPNAILASIIIVAVKGLINFNEAKSLWKTDKRDFLTFMVTFIATLTLGIQNGVFTGILLSLGIMVYRNSVPHIAVLGRLPNTSSYRNIVRFQEAIQQDHLLIIRFDAQLYFGNCEYFRETIEQLVLDAPKEMKALVLDASSIHDVDSSGIHTLHEIISFLKGRNIDFYISGLIGPVRDIWHKNQLIMEVGEGNFFMRIHDAVAYFNATHDEPSNQQAAIQTNIKQK
jgi:SulP family sulfate permease